MDETTTPRDAEQAALPFDLDEPIPFVLTARARRAIAPETLPQLTLLDQATDDPLAGDEGAAGEALAELADVAGPSPVDGAADDASDDGTAALPDDLDDPRDTRPARARALRHAGVDVDQIAVELDVDPLAVRAWVDDIAPVRSAVRRLRALPSTPPADQRARAEARRRRAEEAFTSARAAARGAAAERVRSDPAFVSGLGLLAGVADVSPNGLVVTTRDLAIGRAAVRWLTATVELDPARIRVLLRLAPQVAADTTVHAWHRATGLPVERFRHARWRQAPTADAVEATVRAADPRVAGTIAGWRDALLGSLDEPEGVEHAW